MEWQDWLAEGRTLEEVDAGIYSTLPSTGRDHHYDRIARVYDALIGNGLYNRILWGNRPADYRQFAGQALEASGSGPYLDAGCGTLVFTAPVYAAEHRRPMVLLDRSLGMLYKARRRLQDLCGRVPEHILLLQGDILNLPFRDEVFQGVGSYGMLHLFARLTPLLDELQRVSGPGACLNMSSLVPETGLGRYYYALLLRSGEVASRRTAAVLEAELGSFGGRLRSELQGNMLNLVLCPEG